MYHAVLICGNEARSRESHDSVLKALQSDGRRSVNAASSRNEDPTGAAAKIRDPEATAELQADATERESAHDGRRRRRGGKIVSLLVFVYSRRSKGGQVPPFEGLFRG